MLWSRQGWRKTVLFRFRPSPLCGSLILMPVGFYSASLLLRHNLDPVAVGIRDKVDSHSGILKTDAAHLLMLLMDCLVIIGMESQMELTLSQIVRLCAIL